MSSSNDESEAMLPLATSSCKQVRLTLGKKHLGRRKSAASASPDPPRSDSLRVTASADRTKISRSNSHTGLPNHRDDWASVLMAQGPMQDSIIKLRECVDSYEKEAGKEQLGGLLGVRVADLAELTKLANTALAKDHLKTPGLNALEKFSTVALEYSKLLDVVMNQSPEYACLAWGVIKLLLVANINHAKLRQNVETHLLRIGGQLGLVNQLMYYMPTEKIVEVVALLYASFSAFLRKALKCYAKSRLATVLEAFTFPWETKFQPLVNQINLRFAQIHELVNAGHVYATLQNQNLLHTLHYGQREIQQAVEGNAEALRKEIKQELKREIAGLLQKFDATWIQRFDEILMQQTQPLLPDVEAIANDYVDSVTQLALPCHKTETFLADFISTCKKLRQFRDMTYRQLEDFDQVIKHVKLRNRNLTVYDYQQCVGLLRHEKVKTWLSTNESSILWVNTFQIFGSADWATAFAVRLIDSSANLNYLTVLSHFCAARSKTNSAMTPIIVVKSIIFQVLLHHRKRFLSRSELLTLERFKMAENDMAKLWALFLDVLRIAKADCTWIIIDSIEALQISEDALRLLKYLNALADDDRITVKIFISTRHAGSFKFFSTNLANGGLISSRHPIITIPRGQNNTMASIWAKISKKKTGLSETIKDVPQDASATLVSAESLLFESDDEVDEISVPEVTKQVRNHPEGSAKCIDECEDSDHSGSAASYLDCPLLSSDDDNGGVWMTVDNNVNISRCSSRASFENSSDDDGVSKQLPDGEFLSSADEGTSEDEGIPSMAIPIAKETMSENSQTKAAEQNDLWNDSDSEDMLF